MENNINWQYYNYAMIPVCAPHEEAEITCIRDGSIWSINKFIFFARWTTHFDCPYITNWWYIIKDTPFDISSLKSKRRYEINKGNRHFDVVRLENPEDHMEQLYEIQTDAFSSYPKKYRPFVSKEGFSDFIKKCNDEKHYIYAAFSRENCSICGYAVLTEGYTHLNFNILRVRPCCEKLGVNAAIVYKILKDFNGKLDSNYYICDGSRNISHETHFQNYLEKYFGFRKAYCELHIEYNPKYKAVILLLYKFKDILKKFDSVGLVHKINGVFLMQEIIEKRGLK